MDFGFMDRPAVVVIVMEALVIVFAVIVLFAPIDPELKILASRDIFIFGTFGVIVAPVFQALFMYLEERKGKKS